MHTDWGEGPSTFPPLTSRILSPSKTRRVVINARGYTKLGIESLDFEILFYRAEIITPCDSPISRKRTAANDGSFLLSGARESRLVNVRTKQLYLFEEEERRFVLSTQPR